MPRCAGKCCHKRSTNRALRGGDHPDACDDQEQIASASFVAPMYISEQSPKSLRGDMTALNQTMMALHPEHRARRAHELDVARRG